MRKVPGDLIDKASRGDMSAFEEIYGMTSSFVYNVAFRFSGNTSDAEEITQEVYIKIYKKIKSFGFRSSFKTWVYRITVNASLNFNKRISRERGDRGDYERGINNIAHNEDTGNVNENLIKFLLDKLSPEHRACIILREIQGLSYEEIAKTLEININTVRSRLKRAREVLMAQARKEMV